jgi:hypothetical protein
LIKCFKDCQLYRFFGFFFWSLISISINIIEFVFIIIIICTLPKEYRRGLFRDTAIKAIVFCIVLTIIWIPGTILRFIQYFDHDFKNLYLNLLHISGQKLQMFLIFILFFLTENIFFYYLQFFKKIIYLLKNKDEDYLINNND